MLNFIKNKIYQNYNYLMFIPVSFNFIYNYTAVPYLISHYINTKLNIINVLTINWFVIFTIYILLSVILFFNKQTFKYSYVYWSLIVTIVLQLLISIVLLIYNVQVILDTNITIRTSGIVWKPFTFKLDALALNFIITVYLIGFGVSLYQCFYIEDSYHKNRFIITLNWFIISMILVVISYNWILLLLSWEMLGQTSFFLIGFFKIKISAFKSALKAFFYNRISDLLLLLAFLINLKQTNTSDIIQVDFINTNLQLVGLLITVTALIKSAQFFFFFWLPDSMEAPIPASALIHSATLVSAGFYIILRHINYIETCSFTKNILFISSLFSMIIFSLIASTQTDLKKLLAYSTISNCAFIYLLITFNLYNLAILYFTTHGLLKSLSFMIGGLLIRDFNHYQDTRNWYIKTSKEINLLIMLSISVLMLATLPFFTSYDIKSNLNLLNLSTSYTDVTVKLLLIFYTLNSYNYGIKLPLLLFFKKNPYNKNIISFNDYTNFLVLYIIFFVYFSFIIVLFTFYKIQNFDLITLYTSLNPLFILFFINIIFIKIKVKKDILLLLLFIPAIFILI